MSDSPRQKQSKPDHQWQPILRAADQAAVAGLVLLALVGMAAYWLAQGGLTGELIEIDRAEPLVARFQVDINAATWPELSQVPEIGETLARRIVDARQTGGRYHDHDDLLRVNGIGPRTLERMKPFLLPIPDQNEVAGDVVRGPGAIEN
jgi:competence protein ComEA